MNRQQDLWEARIAASYRNAYAAPLSENEIQMLDAAERAIDRIYVPGSRHKYV